MFIIVELHNVPRSTLSRVIKEFITRDKVPRNTSWEIMAELRSSRNLSYINKIERLPSEGKHDGKAKFTETQS